MSSKKLKGETPTTDTPKPTTGAPVGALANCEVGQELYSTKADDLYLISNIVPEDECPIKLRNRYGAEHSCTFEGIEHPSIGEVVFVIPVKNEAATKPALADVKVGDYLWDNLANEICEVEVVDPSEAWPIITYSLRSCNFEGYEATGDSAPRFTIPTAEQLATLNTDAPQPNDEPRPALPTLTYGDTLWDTHNDTPVMVVPNPTVSSDEFNENFPYALSNGDLCSPFGYHYDFGNFQSASELPRYRLAHGVEEVEQCIAFAKDQQPKTEQPKTEGGGLLDFLSKLLAGSKTVSVHPVMKTPKSDTPKEALPPAQVVNINTQYHEKVSMNITFNIEIHV